jgi:hypothetical protein
VDQILDLFFQDRGSFSYHHFSFNGRIKSNWIKSIGIKGVLPDFIVRTREGAIMTEEARKCTLSQLNSNNTDKKLYFVICLPDQTMIDDFTKDVWDGRIEEVC